MKNNIISKLMLTAALLVGANSAWAETTIGATDKGWGDSGSFVNLGTISADKTLTLTFNLTDYSGDWAGYVLNLTKTNAVAFGGANSYMWFRSCDFAYYHQGDWNLGALNNTNDFGAENIKEFIKGATTVMAIQRLGTQAYVKTTITKDATTYHHYFVQELGTTNDIYAFLCADAATITITDVTTSSTSAVDATTALFGLEDNTGAFTPSYIARLEPNQVMNMHFTNYTSGANIYNNWGIEFVYNDGSSDNYFDLVSGNLNRWGTLFEDAKTATFNNENWPANDDVLKTAMAGVDVTLTIVRSGRIVTITAVHTPTSGTPFVLKHTLEPKDDFSDFANGNIIVKFITDGSHAVCNYPVQKVNAELSQYGWSTFSSPYKLDFSGVSGLSAHAVTGNAGSSVELADVNVAAANTGLLLEGPVGTTTYYNIPVSTGAAYSGTNLLKAGTGASISSETGYTKYVLSVNGTKAEFQKINAVPATVAKGKAYLQFTGDVPAPVLNFGSDNLTSINEVRSLNTEGAEFFNLKGQRVANPTKGLYIANGKKIIVK